MYGAILRLIEEESDKAAQGCVVSGRDGCVGSGWVLSVSACVCHAG